MAAPKASASLESIRDKLKSNASSSSWLSSFSTPSGFSDSSSSPVSNAIVTRKIGVPEALAPTSAYSFFPSWLLSWKLWLVLIILFGIFWIIRPYITLFSNITNMAKSFVDNSIGVVSSTTTSVVDETAKGSDKIVQKVSGTKKPKKQLETAPEPDDSASSVQGGSRSGFCLAGEWKGVRSCVKVANNKECVSGQLFESEKKCVNPSLRV
jgi:hypothetical protein